MIMIAQVGCLENFYENKDYKSVKLSDKYFLGINETIRIVVILLRKKIEIMILLKTRNVEEALSNLIFVLNSGSYFFDGSSNHGNALSVYNERFFGKIRIY